METRQVSVSESMQRGSLCIEAELLIPTLYQLATRPICNRDRCFPDPLDGLPVLCLHSICPHRQMSSEFMPEGFNSGVGSPGMALPVMVSLAPGDAHFVTSLPTNSQESPEGLFQQGPPPTRQPLGECQVYLLTVTCFGEGFRHHLNRMAAWYKFGLATSRVGQSGPAGAIRGISIPFHAVFGVPD